MNEEWTAMEWSTFFTNIVTIIGFPTGIIIYWLQSRKERQANLVQEEKERLAEQQEIDDDLIELYMRIGKNFVEHRELNKHDQPLEKEEDRAAQIILYDHLVVLFERSFLRLQDKEGEDYQEMWASWEDFIMDWLEKPNFRAALPKLMRRENPRFVDYIQKIVGKDYSDVSKLSKSPMVGVSIPEPL